MDLGGNVEHWRSICSERGTQHMKPTELSAEPPALYPWFPVENCILQSPFRELFSSQFGIFKGLLLVPNKHQVLSSTVAGELGKCLEENL